jgi:hypothetical protein
MKELKTIQDVESELEQRAKADPLLAQVYKVGPALRRLHPEMFYPCLALMLHEELKKFRETVAIMAGVLLLMASVASAAPIHYSGNTDPTTFQGANLWYRQFPTDQYHGMFLSTIYDFTADVVTGQLNISQWDVYDDANSMVYSLGSANPTLLTHNIVGDWETAVGSKLFTLKATLPLHVYVNFNPRPIITESLIPSFPSLQRFELNSLSVQIPEPKTLWMLIVPAILVVFWFGTSVGKRVQKRTEELRRDQEEFDKEMPTGAGALRYVESLNRHQRVFFMNRLDGRYCEACGEPLTDDHRCKESEPDDAVPDDEPPTCHWHRMYDDWNASITSD